MIVLTHPEQLLSVNSTRNFFVWWIVTSLSYIDIYEKNSKMVLYSIFATAVSTLSELSRALSGWDW